MDVYTIYCRYVVKRVLTCYFTRMAREKWANTLASANADFSVSRERIQGMVCFNHAFAFYASNNIVEWMLMSNGAMSLKTCYAASANERAV